MSEPTSAALAMLIFIGGVAASIDPHLLSGAFAGGALFVMLSTEYTPLKRVCLMLASIAIGYLTAPEVQHWLGLKSGVVPAVIISAVGVVLIEAARRNLQRLNFIKYFFENKE